MYQTKYQKSESVVNKLRKFKIICEVCEINEETIYKALNSSSKDFEDVFNIFLLINLSAQLL